MRRLTDDAALLERALREGWSSERGELRELLERRPDWIALLEGAEQVPDALGAQAEEDRRLVDESLALARASRRRPAARARRLPSWLLPLAAALLVALGWVLARATAPAPDRAPQYLGDGAVEPNERDVSSVTAERDGESWIIRWSAESPLLEGERYRIDVLDPSSGVSLLPEPLLSVETEWRPAAWETADWPGRILVRAQRIVDGGPSGPSFEFDSGAPQPR